SPRFHGAAHRVTRYRAQHHRCYDENGRTPQAVSDDGARTSNAAAGAQGIQPAPRRTRAHAAGFRTSPQGTAGRTSAGEGRTGRKGRPARPPERGSGTEEQGNRKSPRRHRGKGRTAHAYVEVQVRI